jgi:hypothetical protein
MRFFIGEHKEAEDGHHPKGVNKEDHALKPERPP